MSTMDPDQRDKEILELRTHLKRDPIETNLTDAQKLFGERAKKERLPHALIHKAAEELRMEGKGSHDPHYKDSKKNK